MSHTITKEVETVNKKIDEENPLDIKVTVTVLQFDTITEAADWFEGEEKLLASINVDASRRQQNAVRPPLRDSEVELDWAVAAQRAVDTYAPGRKGGFGVTAEEDKLDELMEGGDIKAMKAYLLAQGLNLK
jgi:hypothetical protein